MTRSKWLTINLLLFIGVTLTGVVALNIGPTPATLFSTNNATQEAILWTARFPRILLAMIVGLALGSSGTAYQALLRNPLADPYILGVSGGAALGSAIGIGLDLPFIGVAALAFVISLAAIAGIVVLARSQYVLSTYRLLLTGVVCNAFAFALIMALQNLVPMQRSHEILTLLMGNLTLADNQVLIWLTLIVGVGFIILLRQSRTMDAWTLGDETAASLGINVIQSQRLIFIAGSLVVGAAVAASGLIGFVGLFIPHAVRLVVGHRHRILLPASGLVGAAFLVIADTVARTIFSSGTYQTELPVGVVTAIVGAPCFLWLLKKRK